MGLKKMQLVFDNPWATYYCGQTVSGRLIIAVDSPKKIRGIVIQFKGESNVNWEETSSRTKDDGTSENVTTNYTGQEQYFTNRFNLLGGSSGETTLPQGEQSYPFSTVLPTVLPSSFEGEHGHVRYTVKAILDRPWKFDQEAKAAFTVVSPLDLNTHATAKDPVKQEREKYFCCLCCKSGPLTLVLSLPASGYVPGQDIPITVEVDNTSDVAITTVKGILRKLLAFHVTTPSRQTKKDTITLSDLIFEPVEAGGSKTWTQHLKVPPLPPSNLNNCSLIDLEYDLKIEAVVDGLHKNLVVKTPIILGTIPLTSFQFGPAVAPSPIPFPVANGEEVKNPANGGGDVTPADPGLGWNKPPTYPTQEGPTGVPPGGQPYNVPPGGQPYNVPPGGQPYNVPPGGQPYNVPPGGQPYNVPPGGQPYNVPPGGQPYNVPPGGQPYNLSPGGQPYNVPPGGQPYNAPPGGQPYNVPPGGQPYNVPPGGQLQGPQGFMQPAPGVNPTTPNLYPEIPPPSFAQSQFATKNIQDASDNKFTQGDQPFAPCYPVYNFQNQ